MMKTRRYFAVLMPILALLIAAPARPQEGISTPDGTIPFRKTARLHTLHARGKNFTARSVYPTFRSHTPLARFVNARISESQKKQFAAWVKETRQELSGDAQTPAPYELQNEPSLSYFAPARLISLRFDSYEYTGGAHGMAIMQTRNFGLVNGHPKELNLGDMFAPGTNYRALVESKVLAKLRQDPNAEWVKDGSVKKLENSQFNNFSITKNGLTWLFNQYEMGPYVVGQFEIHLSRAELPQLKTQN